MPLITDTSQKNKLKKYKMNIKTKYIVGNKILERNSDDSYNDDIENGIRCEKEYYVNNSLIHRENKFDSRIEYTFIFKNQKEKEYTCPNCGMRAKIKNFIDGCPYCKTPYNIDYSSKDMGGKYHYDRVLRDTTYRIVTAIVDLIISILISYVFIKTTSRTFNSYDITKVFLYGLILSLILYYLFYIVDGYIILEPIKRYKDKQNKKQIDFWNRIKIDQKRFYNNLNYEVRKMYYNNTAIIDYDIIDYDDFNEYIKDNILYVNVKVYVRVITYINGKIISKYINDNYLLKRVDDNSINIKEGANIIKCSNCGSSIDVFKGECDYCHTKINYMQEWVLVSDNNKYDSNIM